MKTKKLKFALFALTTLFCLTLLLPAAANAQRRDYLTDEEIELVRDAQEIDKRIGVLTKAIDRRFLVLNSDASQAKRVEKDLDRWGELPKGSRGALLSDIEKILQKAIDDIDDVAAHTKMDEKLFPKAVLDLTSACQGYIPQFKTFFDLSKDEKEKGSILGAIDDCNQIIEASAKVPKEVKKGKSKN
ncbi:hypothetical protein BH24ACI2_BH24ACI2_06170 [soil metagenome]|jgi:hypothetical protein|nr:hypothetical protein [Acidobacteriota bacterium]